ncbi:MAG: lytic murein transglycosylase [Proteobacteria bacterium]|nr:lytic murein transglycosylase [Pseudomonadota bacterium]
MEFAAFVKVFRGTALAAGILPSTYDTAMSGISRNTKIAALTQAQPEFVRPIWSYLDSAVSARRIADGQAALASQLGVLPSIESKYGVPREILVAIWGIETDYGQALGSFNLFEALATLAYSGPRSDFGRSELLSALRLVQQENLDPKQMPASWAGAIGQLQMLPSTYLKSAVDGDGDGKRDLFHSAPDALASAAAEVSSDGWQRGHGWGYEVRLPANFAFETADGETLKSIGDWNALGVRTADGTPLPANAESAVIYLPAGASGPAFLAFGNFKVILKYNNAVSYALAVCTLADQIAGRRGVVAAWPREEQPLSHDERISLQTALLKLGFSPGAIDGVIGRGVRAALRSYQKARGLAADGFATEALLARLLTEVKDKGL